MAKFVWKDEYNSGVKSIDDDHRRFFEIANNFYAAKGLGDVSADVEVVVRELTLTATEHFDREERYMRSARYPQYGEHKHIHDGVRDAFIGLNHIFMDDPQSIDPEKLLDFLEHWLIKHIATVDFPMVKFLRSGDRDPDVDVLRRVAVTIKVDENKANLIRQFAQFLDSQSDFSEQLQTSIEVLLKGAEERSVQKARKLFCKT